MKVKRIIEKLCSHDLTKDEAINLIEVIMETLRNKDSIKFFVEYVAFTSESDDAILHLRAPYYYSKIKGRIEIGDSIDVVIRH